MERQVKHMVRLVDDLLEVSRITRGKIELRKERVTLAAIINSAVETSRPFIDAAHHELTLTVPPEPIILEADPVRLSQVIANLLNNAAKYTEEGGQIWVTAQQQVGEAVLRVRDNGLGIPAAMLGHIFDMFAQVDRTLKRSQGGLGIGLTLARTLVQMHGGRIDVHSEGTGLGTEFTVHLPLALVETAPAAGVPGASAQSSLRTQRRVLIVDDNRDAAESLGMLLKFLGADVVVVYDGPSALDTAGTYRPAIVLMDIGMPGMDGHEVARRLRADPAQRDVTLIALSGWGQEDDRRRSQAAGFNHHLVKPVDAEALQALLTESVSTKPG
jgi:CheY-like chemotaxis protein